MAATLGKPFNGTVSVSRLRPAKRRRYAILSGMSLSKLAEQKSPEADPLEALLTQISNGDEAALGRLYDATVSRVYGLAMKITLRQELAEEVVGDVFLQVWKKSSSYQAGRASPIAWLMLICRSRAIDLLRREQRATRGRDSLDDHQEVVDEKTETPIEVSLNSEFGGQMKTALQTLPEIQRQMIALAYFRGMSHQEVATYTCQPLGTVKSHLRRAQQALRKILTANETNMEAYFE